MARSERPADLKALKQDPAERLRRQQPTWGPGVRPTPVGHIFAKAP
ncbi:hypothetical protein [Streptomyces antibioticus]